MRCPQCATENPAGSNFCARCGGPAGEQTVSAATAGYGQTSLTSATQPVSQDWPAQPDSAGWRPPQQSQPQPYQPQPQQSQSQPYQPQPQQSPYQLPPQQPQAYQPQPWTAGGSHGAPAGPGGGRGLSLAAAIAALAGVGLVIWACALPYVRYSAGGTSISLFRSGSPGGAWFAAEPVGVSVVVAVAAVLLLAIPRGRGPRWVLSGMLAGLGIQTVLLFAGYQYGISGNGVHAGHAGFAGMAAGLVLLTAGLIGMLSAASSQPAART
jgi:hypothetical protein